MNYKIIDNDLVPIYENEKSEKLVNARELYEKLQSKQEFANWIKNRIRKYGFLENQDFIRFDKFIKGDKKGYGNKKIIEYYLNLDTAKEITMIENNEMGRKIRRYFIEVEKRYRIIVETPQNIFDFMRLAIDQIEANEKEIQNVKLLSENNLKEIKKIQSKIDVTIKKKIIA
ncbi:MAG: hypothetical protein HFJ48_07055 [Clostridia bacterium]|nr:hypothetical protein [Clostridia bacterium]